MKLKVGQKLWMVYSDHRRGHSHEVTVEQVGRKWAYLDKFNKSRIYIASLKVDGGEYSSPGQCYLSKEDYEKEREFYQTFAKFKSKVASLYAKKVTLESIAEAAKILKIDMGEE